MAQTTLNVRMDEETKKQFDDFCTKVGMNASVAVNMFAKAVLREQRIPFDIAVNSPNAETIEAIQEGERLLKNAKTKRFKNVEDLFKDLES